MAKIIVELTNRCNLGCRHCHSGRHGGKIDLPLSVLGQILEEAKAHGFDELSFTGGEPTVYRHFAEALRMTHEAGYRFGFNTNGWNFVHTYPALLPYLDRLSIITFSLDGATESTHDQLRGKGSFRRAAQAISICVMKKIPFTINMVVTTHNRHELEQMAHLASRLGSRGLRFGHLMPTPVTTAQGFDLSPWERKVVDAEIHQLIRQHPMPIAMGPGYHTTDPFPCASLHLQELNVNCTGELSTCCHLSGHGKNVENGDIIGNLSQIGFSESYQLLVQENEQFRQAKLAHLANGTFTDNDFFPCWYCSLYYQKLEWLKDVAGHPWSTLMWTPDAPASTMANKAKE